MKEADGSVADCVRVDDVDDDTSKAGTPQAPRAPRGPADPQYMKYAGAGLQFALTFLVCGALGWWLDGKLGTTPWLMIAGILLGACGAMYSLVRRLG